MKDGLDQAKRKSGPNASLATFVALFLLLVTGCAEAAAPDKSPIRPPLYEISSRDGATEGWLLGTIHALPKGTLWRTSSVKSVITKADYLIVEIADLTSGNARETFEELAITTGLPPLSERVAPSLRNDLVDMTDNLGLPVERFRNIETWAAALVLSEAYSDASASNGVDRVIVSEFSNRRIEELEGALEQIVIFDALAEEDQREFLEGVIEQASEDKRDPGQLRRAWLSGDIAALEQETKSGIMSNANLRRALLTGRNNAWLVKILGELGGRPKPLIAVGAGHLVGPEGLAALLEDKGYQVRPLP